MYKTSFRNIRWLQKIVLQNDIFWAPSVLWIHLGTFYPNLIYQFNLFSACTMWQRDAAYNLKRLFEDTSLNWDVKSSFLEWQLVV